MTNKEIMLECIKIAVTMTNPVHSVSANAKELYELVQSVGEAQLNPEPITYKGDIDDDLPF